MCDNWNCCSKVQDLGAEFFRVQSHAHLMIDVLESEKLKIGLSENNFSSSNERKQ